MKIIIPLIITIIGATAVAAPNPQQINQNGLEILLSNADKLRTIEGKSVTQILAESIVTTDGTHNKISNTCRFDNDDGDFKCSLKVLNVDDRLKNRTESLIEIQYILESSFDGLPSKKLFYLSVEVLQAG